MAAAATLSAFVTHRPIDSAATTPYNCPFYTLYTWRPARHPKKLAANVAWPRTNCSADGDQQALRKCRTMEEVYHVLANRVLRKLERLPENRKYFVGVGGVPGSGKSTSVSEVCRLLNEAVGARQGGAGGADPFAATVPMDGFHYYRKQLNAMPNPEEAHARRGAHWTFDSHAYVQFLKDLKEKGEGWAPSFDHGVGDPVERSIYVGKGTRVVLSEGNYLLLDAVHPWGTLAQVFDERWFIECDIDVAMDRVWKRHVKTGKPEDVATKRISGNDRPNAVEIATTMPNADLVVPSLDINISQPRQS
eukprot:jgi/Mesvir1/29530/Mv14933-RA.1